MGLKQRNEEGRALSSTTTPSLGQVPARLLRAAGIGQKGPGHCGKPTGTQVKGADVGLEPVRGGMQWGWGRYVKSGRQPLMVSVTRTHTQISHADGDLSLPLRSSMGTEAEWSWGSPEVMETQITNPQPRAPCCPGVLLDETTVPPQQIQKQRSPQTPEQALGYPGVI